MRPIGEKIKQLREKQNITSSKLAKLAGVSKGYLWQIESNYNIVSVNPSVDFLGKIAKALKVPLFELFLPDENETEGKDLDPEKIRLLIKEIDEHKSKFIKRFRKSGVDKEYRVIGALAIAQENLLDVVTYLTRKG